MYEVPGERLRELSDNIKALSDELDRYKNVIVPELGRQLQSANAIIMDLKRELDEHTTR